MASRRRRGASAENAPLEHFVEHLAGVNGRGLQTQKQSAEGPNRTGPTLGTALVGCPRRRDVAGLARRRRTKPATVAARKQGKTGVGLGLTWFAALAADWAVEAVQAAAGCVYQATGSGGSGGGGLCGRSSLSLPRTPSSLYSTLCLPVPPSSVSLCAGWIWRVGAGGAGGERGDGLLSLKLALFLSVLFCVFSFSESQIPPFRFWTRGWGYWRRAVGDRRQAQGCRRAAGCRGGTVQSGRARRPCSVSAREGGERGREGRTRAGLRRGPARARAQAGGEEEGRAGGAGLGRGRVHERTGGEEGAAG